VSGGVRLFVTPKAGSDDAQCEDAVAAGEGASPLRVAVADGASASFGAAEWARLLCGAWVDGTLTPEDLPDALPTLGRRWRDAVLAEPLPWYAQERARGGAFAAFCGLTLGADGAWTALAVGDCCLFQIRGGEELITAFPLSRPDDFSASPALVGSLPAANANLAAHVRIGAGTAVPGDTFYLMSDALAAWFVRTHAAGRQPWRWLESLGLPHAPAPFPELVARLRAEQGLANDDAALAVVPVTVAAP
jgi:hypothetical protein